MIPTLLNRRFIQRRIYDHIHANPLVSCVKVARGMGLKYHSCMKIIDVLKLKKCIRHVRVRKLHGYVVCGKPPVDERGTTAASRANLSLPWSLPHTNKGTVRKHLVLLSPLAQALQWEPRTFSNLSGKSKSGKTIRGAVRPEKAVA